MKIKLPLNLFCGWHCLRMIKKSLKKSLAICLVAYQMLNDYKTIKTSYGNETHNEN